MLSTMAAITSILQIASQIALILTLVVVIWYTAETHLLRRLQIRPALIVTADLDNDALVVRNLGSSVALNLEIPDFEGLGIMISAKPNWLDFLGVNRDHLIRLRSQDPQWVGLAFTAIFADGPLRILLRYQDIDGHSYETQTEVTSKRTKIVYSRRIGFWSRLDLKVWRKS
jgi:hypothetical protein